VFRAKSASVSNVNSGVAYGIHVKRPGEPLAVLVDTTVDAGGNPNFPVPGQPSDTVFLTSLFGAPLINNAGDVVFFARFNGPTSGSGEGFYSTKTTGGPITIDSSDSTQPQCGGTLTLTRTWTAAIGAGDPVSCEQTITVVDTSPPVLAGIPGDVTVDCDAVPAPASPTATDGCDAAPAVSFEEARTGGACPDEYVLIRTWTATDSCGNAATASQTITVADSAPPTLTGVPADATVECDAVPPPASPTATDACDLDPAVTFEETRSDGACPNEYLLTRTWTATDACGNAATESQTVTVSDTIAPTIVGVPGDLTVECDVVPPPAEPSAGDACDAAPTLNFDESQIEGMCVGDYTLIREWTAADACGNVTEASQSVMVVDDVHALRRSKPVWEREKPQR
jgi:hypothetical protein